MKRSIIALALMASAIPTMGQTYDMSNDIIDKSHLRSSSYTTKSLIDFGFNFEEFIKRADKTKPTVIHSHGCSGVSSDDLDLKNFYTGLGFNFVMLDFHKRGDASASCTSNGGFTYHADTRKRLPPRLKELEHHVNVLKKNGIAIIYATGHSEGGMVVQYLQENVNAVVVHSMSCVPKFENIDNSKIKYLHLVSLNDPLLTRPGLRFKCEGYSNFTTVHSKVFSHRALADPEWESKIKEFLAVK
jgi:predicted alpha/beta-fold hydrolase